MRDREISYTWQKDKVNLLILFLYAWLLLLFCSKMSPLYPINEWSDINLYFNIGKSVFNGRTMYTEAFDHKGPFIFIIYGLGYLISNSSFLGMYIIQVLCWCCAIYTAYFVARLYLDKIYAFIAALAFPVILLSHTAEGGSAEEFITIFIIVSMALFIFYFKDRKEKRHPMRYMFVHGLMCGMTILTKFNLIIFWIFPLIALFYMIWKQEGTKDFIKNILIYAAGILIITLPITFYLYFNDALDEAWNIYIVLNKKYAQMGSFADTISLLLIRFYQRLRFDTFEFIIILIGAIGFPLRYIENRLGALSLILSFFALYIIIFMSPTYIYYYSIPYYVFAMPGCIVIIDYMSQYIKLKYAWHMSIIFAVIALCIGINRKNYFGLSSEILLRKEKPASLNNQFGTIISKEAHPTLLNLGLDLGNCVFTQQNIVPNVRFFISPNIPYEVYPKMRDEQTKYIENKEVQFIILNNFTFNAQYFEDLPALKANYEPIDSYKESDLKTYYLLKRKD